LPAPDPCVRFNVTGISVTGTGKDGIVANGLGGQPTVITGNTVASAGTYGIRLVGADRLTLNDNTVNSSGGAATAFRYPAIYLSAAKADFELLSGDGTVARNHGSANGLDAIVVHGEATQPLTWLTTAVLAPVTLPAVPADHFGYVLDGGLTVDAGLTTNKNDVVKVLTGAINVKGPLKAADPTTFTSAKDGAASVKLCDVSFDSVFIQRVAGACPSPTSGDWGGINVTGAATLYNTTIAYDDGLTVAGGSVQYSGGAMHDIAKNAIAVTGSPLSVTNVAFSKVGLDAIDSTNSGSPDTITDDQFDQVTGVSINLQNSPADLRRNVFTNDTALAVKTAGATVTIQCSSIQSGGLSGDNSLTVKESDFAPTVGVTAPLGASAENNWWGQGGGPSGQLSGGVAVVTSLARQSPTVTIAVAGMPSATQPLDNVRSDGSLGTGLVQATLTFSRNMNPEPLLPNVSYTSSPVAFSGAWKTNDPRTWVGTAPITAALAVSGTHTVSASGAHSCVPDPQHNVMTAPAPKAFAVETATLPAVTVSAPDLIGAGSARLHGHIDPNGWATGASGQFVLTNFAAPFDQHGYATPVPPDKVTPIDVNLVAGGLTSSATYRVQLKVPSVNGTATQSTADTVTTTGAASQLAVTSQPPSAPVAGATFSTTFTVTDGSAKVVSDYNGSVTVALTTPPGATLSGTVMKTAVNGVANYTDLSVNKTGTYTLTATSASLTPATSSSFTVQPGVAAQLAFTQLPSNPKTGITMTPAVLVAVQDSLGNTVTSNTSSITISLASNPAAGTLSGTLSKAAVAGVATFDNLALDKAGTYTFGATGAGFTAPASSSITVT
jgi:parallel beta-helix repeat protein